MEMRYTDLAVVAVFTVVVLITFLLLSSLVSLINLLPLLTHYSWCCDILVIHGVLTILITSEIIFVVFLSVWSLLVFLSFVSFLLLLFLMSLMFCLSCCKCPCCPFCSCVVVSVRLVFQSVFWHAPTHGSVPANHNIHLNSTGETGRNTL